MDVRMPDGTVVINVPDGITQEDLQARYNASQQKSAFARTAQSDSNLENLLAGAGGSLYAPWLGIKAITGNASPEDVQAWKDSMAGLWKTPMGKVGTVGGGVVSGLPLALAAGSSLPGAAASGGVYGALQPESDWSSRLKNAAVGAVGSLAGQGAGSYLANASKAAPAAAALSPKDQLLQRAIDAGYKIAPNEAGQQSALQWVGGQIKTQQTMASKNVPNTTRLAAQEVGLPGDQPITVDALKGVRSAEGQAYDPVRALGVIKSDPEIQAVADQLQAKYDAVTNSFKSLKNPTTETLLTDLKSPQFDANGLVEAVSQFRREGFANIAKPETRSLGMVQLEAQDALERLADRALVAAGQPDAMAALQAARTQIAKTYSIQNALDPNGNVVASKLTRQLVKGKPLSGNLETIAQMAAAFPKSLQNYAGTPPAFSALDYGAAGLGTIGALAAGHPSAAIAAAAPIARPIVRAIVSSGPYQRNVVAPAGGIGLQDFAGLLNSPYLRMIETAAPSAGLLSATR